MTKLAFSPAAVSDLKEIGDYISDKDDQLAAQRFVARIKAKCVVIGNNPLIYPNKSDLMAGARMVAFDRYLIFFSVNDHEVRIERVLHSARNLPTLLNPPNLP